jgi:GNAT superfamily N-acetyltransferase
MPVEIVHAGTPVLLAQVGELLMEYGEFIGEVSGSWDRPAWEEEAATLPELYTVVLLARVDDAPAGIVMLREHPEPEGVCEARRLYVRPAFRRRGVARALVERLMAEARERGCHEMRLVTVKLFEGAQPLYESLGFASMEPWRATKMPLEQMVFMERPLQ